MGSAYFVIRSHDGPRAPLFDGGLESRQIYLVEGAVAEVDVDVVAPLFLVIQGEVLHAGCHSVLLHAPYVGHAQGGSEVGVFAHVLEVAPAQRRAVDVYARPEEYVFFAVAGFLADGLPVAGGEAGVPRGGQAGERGKGRAAVVVPACIIPFVPVHFGPHAVGAVGMVQFGNSQAGASRRAELALCVAQAHLFFHRHAAQGVFHPGFQGLGVVQIDGQRAACLGQCCRRGQQGAGEQVENAVLFHGGILIFV